MKPMLIALSVGLVALALTGLALRRQAAQPVHQLVQTLATFHAQPVRILTPPSPTAAKIVAGAKTQIGTAYDASYCTLKYPMGDVAADRGACTDVVIRALRASGYDLQPLVHEDLSRHWDRYPHKWGLARPDPNIDHRRVPNLAVFFQRHGQTLTTAVSAPTLRDWQPGDIVCWKLMGDHDHIGVLSDKCDAAGMPFVIHNIGQCAEEDCLTRWPIAGHYRYPKSGASHA